MGKVKHYKWKDTMADKITLTVQDRQIVGKKVKQLRKQGLTPAVVYGHDFKAQPVVAHTVEAQKTWSTAGKHHVIELVIGDTKKSAMIKNVDFDPIKHQVRHLGFQVVKQNEKVQTEVPVRIADEGSTAAEKAGLVILQALETVEISALPKNLPDFLEVTSDKLVAAGDHVTIADIITTDGVTIEAEPEVVVATVYEPSNMVSAEAEEETQAAAEVPAENGGAKA